METLKLVFFILGSVASLGFIIFFITLLFNKDDGFYLDQCSINYLSREVDRLEKKIDKETECKKCHLDFAEATKFEAKEKKYVEKIHQLEKILADEEIKVSDCGKVVNLKADKLKYEKYELNLEKSGIQKEVERIIEDTEKRRTEAYDLIANVYKFEQTIMPEYGRYKAGYIDISELGKELESTFREYFRREKIIKEKSK